MNDVRMMGEVVAKAASICRGTNAKPARPFMEAHSTKLELLRLPGKAGGPSLDWDIVFRMTRWKSARTERPMPGSEPSDLPGIVDRRSRRRDSGAWTEGTGLRWLRRMVVPLRLPELLGGQPFPTGSYLRPGLPIAKYLTGQPHPNSRPTTVP